MNYSANYDLFPFVFNIEFRRKRKKKGFSFFISLFWYKQHFQYRTALTMRWNLIIMVLNYKIRWFNEIRRMTNFLRFRFSFREISKWPKLRKWKNWWNLHMRNLDDDIIFCSRNFSVFWNPYTGPPSYVTINVQKSLMSSLVTLLAFII